MRSSLNNPTFKSYIIPSSHHSNLIYLIVATAILPKIIQAAWVVSDKHALIERQNNNCYTASCSIDSTVLNIFNAAGICYCDNSGYPSYGCDLLRAFTESEVAICQCTMTNSPCYTVSCSVPPLIQGTCYCDASGNPSKGYEPAGGTCECTKSG
jgi:hypothetical protein